MTNLYLRYRILRWLESGPKPPGDRLAADLHRFSLVVHKWKRDKADA